MQKGTHQRSVITAATVASIVMLTLGIAYRLAAAWLAAPVLAEPVSQDRLDQLPLQIGGWVGQEVTMDPNIIDATDTDACLSRSYFRRDGSESVSLWVASGVQTRDLMPHRPEVCYIGSGYTLIDQRAEELLLGSGAHLPCRIMQFAKGGLSAKRVMVLYYYLVDGIYCQNVGKWRFRVFDRIGYVTQVQVVASVPTATGVDAVQRLISDFAVESAVPLARLFEDLDQRRRED